MKAYAIQGWLLSAIVILAAGPAAGEVVPPQDSMLEFHVENDFNIASLDGATIAWRWPTAPDRAWRIGLSPNFTQESRGDIDRPYDRRDEYDSYGLDVDVTRLRYRPLQGRTRGYWGFGPSIGVAYAEYRSVRSDSTEAVRTTQKRIDRDLQVGIVLVAGVEYVVSDDFSLTAEYVAEIKMSWQYASYDDHTRRAFSVRGRGARLGLSARF